MAKKVKDKQLNSRVEGAFYDEVAAYIEAADGLSQADLVRLAVTEFMINHPVKQPRKQLITQPGREED